jgi:NAD(P)-dependent dehydrogenase (short-subunit alcohol dehydrogenase family)
MEVTGWCSAKARTGPGMVSVGTNGELTNGRNNSVLVTLKLVGYAEAVRALLPAMNDESSIVLFGGSAKDRPYPGSTTVTTANGGIESLVRTLAVELAPIRVNAVHPSPVGDNPFWQDKPAAVLEGLRSRTPMGRLVATEDVVGGVAFLLENRGVNGTNLDINGGFLLT